MSADSAGIRQPSKSDLGHALQSALAKAREKFSDGEMAFVKRIYKDGLARYERRLMQYGFVGLDNVLDAGCGFGQWSLALAGLNRMVEACDESADRIDVVAAMASTLGIGNLNARQASLYKLPY